MPRHFHYASIKTKYRAYQAISIHTVHTNMYTLKSGWDTKRILQSVIILRIEWLEKKKKKEIHQKIHVHL